MFLSQELFLAGVRPLNLVGNLAKLKLKSFNRVRSFLHVNLWNGDVHDLFTDPFWKFPCGFTLTLRQCPP